MKERTIITPSQQRWIEKKLNVDRWSPQQIAEALDGVIPKALIEKFCDSVEIVSIENERFEEMKTQRQQEEWNKCDPYLTSEEHLEIVRLRTEERKSVKEIMEAMEMSEPTVRRHLKRAMIPKTLLTHTRVVCPACKIEFEVRNSVLKQAQLKNQAIFCSKDCWRASLSEKCRERARKLREIEENDENLGK
ncbi:MAG: ArsR family transcriptional regulator [Patescibacteria group bacterium]|nr:ArsR family transcriptional regulator [Patescibacteria group bacterium]